MFGYATTSESKISKNAETKEYSSMLYDMRITSEDEEIVVPKEPK